MAPVSSNQSTLRLKTKQIESSPERVRPGTAGGDRSCVRVQEVQARGMANAEIDEKLRDLAGVFQRVIDLVGGQEALRSSGREQGWLEQRGTSSSSPHEALRAVGNSLRAIGVAAGAAAGASSSAAQPVSQPSNQVASIVRGFTPCPCALGDQHDPSAP